MGLNIGLIMCTMYRLKIQELLYKAYFALERKMYHHSCTILVLLNLLFAALPIIIFSFHSRNNPIRMHPYLLNLNKKCDTTEYTSLTIQESSMRSHALVNLAFGIMFGMLAAGPNAYLYLLGKWSFAS